MTAMETIFLKLKAAWRHPFNKKKRKAYPRMRFKQSTERPRVGRVDALVLRDERESTHAKLFENYVRNSLCEYPEDQFIGMAAVTDNTKMKSDVKLIAYYLPQFHPIPENDEWWGKGFTEWRNVARAFPQFTDHYQPRVPGELGYYDLRIVDIMRRQAQLAKQYSIDAFCFHFYWFAGKTLLELPLQNLLAETDIDMKFSLCWANENWSRRWDGSEEDLLIAQQHSPEDDLEFIRYLNGYFSDDRYLKVDGKPVLTVYRPSQLPNALATAQRWRQEIVNLGHPGIYLIATNAFAFKDYQLIGFDALSEFPPHHVRAPNVQDQFELSRFREGRRIRLYSDIVTSEKSRGPLTGGVVHPGVMPSWDNSARRPRNGEIIHGSTPALFREWLDHSIEIAANNPQNQKFVFINAWNEWAEGAYLEPDRRYGYAYLEACRAAVNSHVENRDFHATFAGEERRRPNQPTVLLCAHWAARQIFGGERSFVDLARGLAAARFNVVVVLPEGGDADYIALLSIVSVEVRVFRYAQWTANRRKSLSGVSGFLRAIREVKPDIVYVNTTVINAPTVASRLLNVPVIIHAREIFEHDQHLVSQIGLPPEAIVRQVIRSADLIVANSSATCRSFRDAQHVTVVPNAIDVDALDVPNEVDTKALRFGIISSNFSKKGITDFVSLAKLCLTEEPRAQFVIIGPTHRVAETLRHDGYDTTLPSNLELMDYQPSAAEALRQINVVVNFSHFQESFGRTILEGMAAGRPSIAYDWGALPELIEDSVTGFLIPYRKPQVAVAAVKRFCDDPSLLKSMGDRARERATKQYSLRRLQENLGSVCQDFLARETRVTAGPHYAAIREKRISSQRGRTIDIIVCVHNALDDVQRCLQSIREYSAPHHRLILVDDGSGPETRQFLKQFAQQQRQVHLVRHAKPKGYTRAANAGLRETTAEFVILLNSDTIVADGWAEKMADAVFSTQGAGIVGPMSNAASYQSLPEVVGTQTQTAVNELPPGMNVDDMNKFCEDWTSGVVMPYVPLVHGFCFGITREAIRCVGEFDETLFPEGYGEENDFCLRALELGIWPVIATHTFVFHAKSKSYSQQRRSVLSEQAQKALYQRHGRRRFLECVELLQSAPRLVALREHASRLWHDRGSSTEIALHHR